MLIFMDVTLKETLYMECILTQVVTVEKSFEHKSKVQVFHCIFPTNPFILAPFVQYCVVTLSNCDCWRTIFSLFTGFTGDGSTIKPVPPQFQISISSSNPQYGLMTKPSFVTSGLLLGVNDLTEPVPSTVNPAYLVLNE